MGPVAGTSGAMRGGRCHPTEHWVTPVSIRSCSRLPAMAEATETLLQLKPGSSSSAQAQWGCKQLNPCDFLRQRVILHSPALPSSFLPHSLKIVQFSFISTWVCSKEKQLLSSQFKQLSNNLPWPGGEEKCGGNITLPFPAKLPSKAISAPPANYRCQVASGSLGDFTGWSIKKTHYTTLSS